MGDIWLALRATARSRWRSLAALALLLGLIGGIALTAAAGARRTDTSFPRLLRASRASQYIVSPAGNGFRGYFAALAALAQVRSLATNAFYDMALARPGRAPVTGIIFQGSPSGATGLSMDQVKVVAGRLLRPGDPREVLIDQRLAARFGLQPGSTLPVIAYRQAANDQRDLQAPPVHLAFRVAGIVVFTDEILPATPELSEPEVLLSPAFAGSARAQSYNPGGGAANVVLRPGADRATFARAATALAARAGVGTIRIIDLREQHAATQRAIQPQAVALAIFAALVGLIGLAVLAQLLSRELSLGSAESPVMRTLGMTRQRLTAICLARMALVTIAASAVAVIVAIAASPLMPIGPARLAEPAPGVEVNLAVVGAGFAAIALLPLLVLVPVAWRAAGRASGPLGVAEPAGPDRASRLGTALGATGSVTGCIGVPMAFEPGHGRSAVPVRSALVGTAVAVTTVVAALIFGTSLIGLVRTPHRYGQNWELDLNLQAAGVPLGTATGLLHTAAGLSSYAAGDYGQLNVEGIRVPAIGIDQVRGRNFLTMVAGRPPSGPGQIVLGARTLARLHKQVGQRVTVNGGRPMTIVGSAVFAGFSMGGGTATDLGTGAAVAASLLSKPNPPFCVGRNLTCYNFFLLRFKPGTDLRAAALRLEHAVEARGCPRGLCVVTRSQQPADIQNYRAVRETPFVLGAVLSLLAIGALSHVLMTGVARKRRDLAVLKTLGMRRSELLRVVSWQASALAITAVAIGIPLGAVAGRWLWTAFARSAGIAGGADVPVVTVLAVIPVTVVVANLLAAAPGWAAARVAPAAILRAE